MKIQYILHADFELPGALEAWAKQNQYRECYCRPFAGEKLPNPDEFDLLILMGGPQSPLTIEEAPYLSGEMALIKNAVHQKKPVLGFYLGAQLIGEALGAKTERSPHKEVGIFPIELTQEGMKDPLFEYTPAQFSVVHWHNDMPGLTSGAKVLAFSKGCPRQIVRYLPFVYGFQCHPEATRTGIEMMIKHCPNDLFPRMFVQSAKEFLAQDFDEANRWMMQFMDRFVYLHSRPVMSIGT